MGYDSTVRGILMKTSEYNKTQHMDLYMKI